MTSKVISTLTFLTEFPVEKKFNNLHCRDEKTVALGCSNRGTRAPAINVTLLSKLLSTSMYFSILSDVKIPDSFYFIIRTAVRNLGVLYFSL